MTDIVDAFRAAMRGHGLIPPDDIQADGAIHRCDVDGKNGKGDGAYLLHLDGIAAGGFQNWQNGGWTDWFSRETKSLTAHERAQLREAAQRAQKQREIETARRQEQARRLARDIWERGSPAPADHPYLVKKGIRAPELRRNDMMAMTIAGTDCDAALIVPIRDSSGKLQSVEFITGTGEKRFLPGGQKTGCYFAIGGKPDTVIRSCGHTTSRPSHSMRRAKCRWNFRTACRPRSPTESLSGVGPIRTGKLAPGSS